MSKKRQGVSIKNERESHITRPGIGYICAQSQYVYYVIGYAKGSRLV